MSDQLTAERSKLAVKLVSLRYPTDNPAFDISATLDEPVERITLADFYNGPAAAIVREQPRWQWRNLDHSELNGIITVRDLGKLLFAHLMLKPAIADPLAGDTP